MTRSSRNDRVSVGLASFLVLGLTLLVTTVLLADPSGAQENVNQGGGAYPCSAVYVAQPVDGPCVVGAVCVDTYVAAPIMDECGCPPIEVVTVDGETYTVQCAYTYAEAPPTAVPAVEATAEPVRTTTPEPTGTPEPEPAATPAPQPNTSTPTPTTEPTAATPTPTLEPPATVQPSAIPTPAMEPGATVEPSATPLPVTAPEPTATSVTTTTATATPVPVVAASTSMITGTQNGSMLSGTVTGSCPCPISVEFSNGVTVSTFTAPDGSWSVPLAAGSSGTATVTSGGTTMAIAVTLPAVSVPTASAVTVNRVAIESLTSGVLTPVLTSATQSTMPSEVAQPPLALTGGGLSGVPLGLTLVAIGASLIGFAHRQRHLV